MLQNDIKDYLLDNRDYMLLLLKNLTAEFNKMEVPKELHDEMQKQYHDLARGEIALYMACTFGYDTESVYVALDDLGGVGKYLGG